jgi:hypothetical protein
LIVLGVLIALLLLVALMRITGERRLCIRLCEAQGFADVRFTPENRNGPALCYCLSKEEAAQTTKVPKGSRMPLSRTD